MSTILITGSSSGIGEAAAKHFAENGWHVIATMRNVEKGSVFQEYKNIQVLPLDITDSEQIQRIAAKVLAEQDVDVLFNNAGYGVKGPLESIDEKEIRNLYETDFFGTVQVIQQFLPYFKEKRKGCVLTTGSIAGIVSFPLDGIYGAAKRAVAGMMESLYYELKPYGVAAKLLLPGAIKTRFQLIRHEAEEYEKSSKRLTKILIPDFDTQFTTAEEAAEVVWNAVNDGQDRLHYVVGKPAEELYDKYKELGVEEFKQYFYQKLFLE